MQKFNFIDSGSHFTIQTLNGVIVVSDKQYPKNSLTTSVFGNTLYISTIGNQRLVDYNYLVDISNLISVDITDLQNQLDSIFASGSVDTSLLNLESTQLEIKTNVKHKKNRIEGAADFEMNSTYIGNLIDTMTLTGTTDIGGETLTITIIYDVNNNITKIKYS